MYRTYKRKLILTKRQEQRFRSWIGTCRYIYNLAKEVREESYKKTGKGVGKNTLLGELKYLRTDYKWIKDVPHETLAKTIEKLDAAYLSFFKKKTAFPRWANKKSFKSISFRDIKIKSNRVKITNMGYLKFFKDSDIIGIPKTATIKIEPTGFFITIICEADTPKFVSENQAIGLDMGLKYFCIDSNGGFIDNPKHFKKYERKLRIENRSLARKKKGSKSWYKQVKRLSLVHHKIANVRKDFLHKQSTIIAKANSTVFMEDLNVSGMSKNGNLSKHILDTGWAAFRTMLTHKTNVVAINPAYTSQKCNACGNVDKLSRLSQSEYKCVYCGHEDNADVNAAKNILSGGTALVRQREALACA